MQLTQDDLARIGDGDVVTSGGDKIGGIGQIYVDDTTGLPAWVTVKTGLFGTSESFAPLEGASISGRDIQVSFDKDTIKNAPRVDADGKITHEEEDQLYAYYNLGSARAGVNVSAGDQGGVDADGVDQGTVGGDYTDTRDGAKHAEAPLGTDGNDTARGTVGHDTSGPTTDDAMTLSEEQLRVGTQTQESGRARLRKYVVTENVTQTVPVSHEEVRIEREPITEANAGAAEAGPDISEEEHEVVLHAETPVVQKEAVPVERVRLATETVTEQATVSEDVRKEQIDTDTDGSAANR
jgi:uncharacterized protein (TIGR02271 family)